MGNDEKTIKALIEQFMASDTRVAEGLNTYSIENIWRDTFGDMISRYTERVVLKQDTLYVYIQSAPLKQELSMHKDAVLAKLNAQLKYRKVSQLVIK